MLISGRMLTLTNVKRLPRSIFGWLIVAFLLAADTQASTTPTNTMVRFRIAYGSSLLGNVDVELFDQDKPITVSNFLTYAQSHRLDNSILQRCIPHFVLQGGEYTVPNPYSSAPFEIVSRIPIYGNITNEFHVGTLRSNVFGTIAMAKVPGDPNSASSAWFFNLADNSTNLDNLNGGFTVFGQVKSGLNVLSYFNTLSVNSGIIVMTNDLYAFFCPRLYRYPDGANIGFPELPVAFNGLDCVRYNDLFTVQIIMLSGRDVLAPKIIVTSPSPNASVSGDTVTVRGTATDNLNVASVLVYLNTNASVTALGTNSWSVTLTDVPPGTNLLVIEATDTSGNRAQTSRSFFRSVRVPLSLRIHGDGFVLGANSSDLLELGRNYTLVAKPAPDYLFAGWTGTVTEASATLHFLMESNTSINAVFRTNLFPAVQGTYNGLFYNPHQVDQQSSGFLTLTVGNSGAYTAKLLSNGKSYSFKGSFDLDGNDANLVLRPGTNALLLKMALDLTGGSDRLTGVVTNNQLSNMDPSHAWRAELMADRSLFNSVTNPAPFAGKYTMIIPVDTNSPAGPAGDGFGNVTVDANGRVSLSGFLADGTKGVQKAPLSKKGQWPLYLPLYKDKGAIVSWVTFTNQDATDFRGLLNWFKQSQPTAKYFRGGFTNEVNLAGSRYTPPTTNRVLNFTSAFAGFTNGNLATDFANEVTLGANNKVLNLSSNKLTLTIAKPTGLFTGSVTPPGRSKAVAFKGAVLQKQSVGSGYFLGTNASGRVSFAP